MVSDKITIMGFDIDCYSVNTLIIGSGAASLNAALKLSSFGQKDLVIVTEKWGGGTSNNAGSDKQTYYKLSLTGEEPDSALMMANDLFSGKCMHGDIALCEAQGSVEAFMNLVSLGVPFPQNKYGAWVGYKTDNDPRARGTSAGPHTSKKMFEVLATEIKRRKIKIFDRYQVVALLHTGEGEQRKITGAMAINLKAKEIRKAFVVFNSVNIILGTGGPAGIYETSVYPVSQSGSTGIAFEAGATGQNLTETQFGIASIKFRWNLSGSYQQVIPRYISTDQNGRDEREFLNDSFKDLRSLSKAIFLKGYQWPFNVLNIRDAGSSLIDLLVYHERVFKNRRVFLDYSKNPTGASGELFDIDKLDGEVIEYLKRSGAEGKTPFARLASMNPSAIDVYLDKKIDIAKEYLEIAVCAQHNNGGLKGNIWWESDVRHLFAVGEVNGSHGVSRPGGSALNSGQVGSHRAALFISKKYNNKPPQVEDFLEVAGDQIGDRIGISVSWGKNAQGKDQLLMMKEIRKRMSESAGIIRTREKIRDATEAAFQMLKGLNGKISASTVREIAGGFRLIDHSLTHYLYLEAIRIYIEAGGRSRGSCLVAYNDGELTTDGLEEGWRFPVCGYDRDIENNILEISFRSGKVEEKLTIAREIPSQELWFEKVWKKNLEDNFTEC
jgi:succinate dehydrogenase/fumarate reductase flavoprotein subunit